MKKQSLAGLSLLLLALCGCKSANVHSSLPPVSGPASPTSSSITMSPTSAAAGSPDLLLTITGSNFGRRHPVSQALWSANGSQTVLATTFVSSTQLTAVVPSNLLASPGTAQVFVQSWDPMGDTPPRNSGSAGFSITALPAGAAAISSISPESAPAGSSDLTLTITGNNFDNQRFHTTIVGWSTNPTDTHCCNTWLQTTFVSSNELVVLVPVALLQTPVTAQVFVETGDPQGITDGVSYPRSNSVSFTVGQ